MANMTPQQMAAAAKAAGIDMSQLGGMDTDQLLKNAASMMPGMMGGGGDEESGHKLNKQEKKARKTIQKLGMKLQKGFNRVTIKKSKKCMSCFDSNESSLKLNAMVSICWSTD